MARIIKPIIDTEKFSKRQDNLSRRVKSALRSKDAEEKTDMPLTVSSGSMLLNLACSDSTKGAFHTQRLINIIGDSSAGKSMLALSVLAEASKLKAFDSYRLIYDDTECALSFEIGKMFGKRLKERIELINYGKNRGLPCSITIQEFEYQIMDLSDSKEPFIYILDSFDGLTCDEDIKKEEERRTAHRTQRKISGSMDTHIPKIASKILRRICKTLRQNNSLLIIISQTRQKINSFFEEKTRSGGDALKFYSSLEIWLHIKNRIKVKRQAKKYVTGLNVIARVKKNRTTGKERDITFPIYYDYGIDDISSMIDFLVEQKAWIKTSKGINANLWDDEKHIFSKEELIREIENRNLEAEVRNLVQQEWNEIEESLNMQRKKKYD